MGTNKDDRLDEILDKMWRKTPCWNDDANELAKTELKAYIRQQRAEAIASYKKVSKIEDKAILDEYYTNKFLEIIGPHTSLSKKEIKNGRIYVLGDPHADAVDRYKDELAKRVKAELRQAIKQLGKRGE